MAKDPAFLFYSSDFLTGTMTLSFEDKGKYIMLLCLMHQQGRLDETTICLLVGSFSVNLKNKFKQDENGKFYSERLEFETSKRNKYTESRRNNGLLGGAPKKKKKANGKAKNNHMVNHKDNLMEDENINENKDIIKKENETEIEKKLNQFYAFRIELKKPMLESSKQSFKNKLQKLSKGNIELAIEILEQSIANGWQGIFELKNNNYGNNTSTNNGEHSLNNIRELANKILEGAITERPNGSDEL